MPSCRRPGLNGPSRALLAGLGLLAALGAGALLGAGEVRANGDSQEIFRSREGAYEIVVGVQPRVPTVGTVHFTVTPLDSQTSEPVASALVTLTANDSEGNAVYTTRAVNTPVERQYYDANILFEDAGFWLIQVDVESESLGKSTVLVPLQVDEAPISAGLTGTIVWVGILAVLAGGVLYIWRKQGRRPAAG